MRGRSALDEDDETRSPSFRAQTKAAPKTHLQRPLLQSLLRQPIPLQHPPLRPFQPSHHPHPHRASSLPLPPSLHQVRHILPSPFSFRQVVEISVRLTRPDPRRRNVDGDEVAISSEASGETEKAKRKKRETNAIVVGQFRLFEATLNKSRISRRFGGTHSKHTSSCLGTAIDNLCGPPPCPPGPPPPPPTLIPAPPTFDCL